MRLYLYISVHKFDYICIHTHAYICNYFTRTSPIRQTIINKFTSNSSESKDVISILKFKAGIRLGWVVDISPIDYSRVLGLCGEYPPWGSF